MRHSDVWVFAEQENNKIKEVSIELLGKGKELANKLGSKLCSFIFGHKIDNLVLELIQYGCDKVYVLDRPELEVYMTLPYARAAIKIIKEYKPEIVLYGATIIGRDLAPRIASNLRAGLTADCTDLQIGDYEDKIENKVYTDLLYQIRPAFGGNIIATIVNPMNFPQMATVREGVMKMPLKDTERGGEIIEVKVELPKEDFIIEILKREQKPKKVNLKNAGIIVSGGMGVGSKENFKIIFDLAHTLGGEVAGSRAAVDAGFIERERQVGQTGTTVRPRVYIAVGISGAVQHRAGMSESGKIIAINKDPNASIFSIAHYGIIGDLNEIVPKLIKIYKEESR
ncbi:MAG: electron transfer flavoprotein subunit alpha/FixB family protein [Candidatus Hydrogenedentota bacterium]